MGRHMGHTFVYLQDAVQDCRAITIQLLADAQQGRQAVQVRQGHNSHGIKEANMSLVFCLFVLPLDSGTKATVMRQYKMKCEN